MVDEDPVFLETDQVERQHEVGHFLFLYNCDKMVIQEALLFVGYTDYKAFLEELRHVDNLKLQRQNFIIKLVRTTV